MTHDASTVDVAMASLSEASTTAVIAHWLFAACLGLPATPVLTASNGAQHLAGPAASSITPDAPPAPSHVGEYPQDLAGSLNLICAMAVGWLKVDGFARHVAPTSRNRASVQAICLLPRADKSGASALYFDTSSGSLITCADVPQSATQDFSEGTADSAVLLLLASPNLLRERYGAAARRLACHDAGIALEHAERAARGLGLTATHLEQVSASNILQRIGVPISDKWELPCVPLAIKLDSIGDSQRCGPAANRDHPLRPMCERRSIRQFSSVPIATSLVLHLEYVLEQLTRRTSWFCDSEQPVTLIRIFARDEYTIEVSRIALNVRACAAAPVVLPRHLVHQVIGQRDLAVAPLIYLLESGVREQGDGNAAESACNWAVEGVLCSALWMEAQDLGLVGTCYGSADAAPLSIAEGAFKRLALCLGERALGDESSG